MRCSQGLIECRRCAARVTRCFEDGDKIKQTKTVQVLHTALRNLDGGPVMVDRERL